MNTPNQENNTPEAYSRDRKIKREQLKKSSSLYQKNQLRQAIIQSQINQKKQELEKKRQEQQSIKQDIKESYYQKIEELTSLYKDLGIIHSGKGLSRHLEKSPSYFKSSQKNGNNPTIAILDDIIIDLEVITENLDYLIDESLNHKDIKSRCDFLLSFFKNCKNRILFN